MHLQKSYLSQGLVWITALLEIEKNLKLDLPGKEKAANDLVSTENTASWFKAKFDQYLLKDPSSSDLTRIQAYRELIQGFQKEAKDGGIPYAQVVDAYVENLLKSYDPLRNDPKKTPGKKVKEDKNRVDDNLAPERLFEWVCKEYRGELFTIDGPPRDDKTKEVDENIRYYAKVSSNGKNKNVSTEEAPGLDSGPSITSENRGNYGVEDQLADTAENLGINGSGGDLLPARNNEADETARKTLEINTRLYYLCKKLWGAKARKCVRTNYLRFLDYEFEYHEVDHEELILKGGYLGGKVSKAMLPTLDDLGRLKFHEGKLPTQRERPYLHEDGLPTYTDTQYFLAVYPSSSKKNLLAHVKLTWGVDIRRKNRWPFRATLVQYNPEQLNEEMEFWSIDSIESREHGANSVLTYIQFKLKKSFGVKTRNRHLDDVLIQCVLVVGSDQKPLTIGTFSSISVINVDVKTIGGLFVLTRCSPVEFEKLLQQLASKSSTQEPSGVFKNYLLSQFYVNDRILVADNFPFEEIDKSHIHENWDKLLKSYSSTFDARYFCDLGKEISTIESKISIFRSGRCKIEFLEKSKLSIGVLHGVCHYDGKLLKLKFTALGNNGDHYINFYYPTINGSAKSENINELIGVYFGHYPDIGLPFFQNGITQMLLEGHSNNVNSPWMSHTRPQRESEVSEQVLRDYSDIIAKKKVGAPDGTLLNSLLAKFNPVKLNDYNLLRLLGLHKHYKYFTFRIPEAEKDKEEHRYQHRIEKCDLVFEDDFESVTVLAMSDSGERMYRGKTYYNGHVLLMILEDDSPGAGKNQNYFTIQLHLPKADARKAETIVGTSTWEEYHLESKMIVLVKAAKIDPKVDREDWLGRNAGDDTEVEVYSVGTNEHIFNQSQYESILAQDKLYKGAVVYLMGRINRHVQVSSKFFDVNLSSEKNNDPPIVNVFRPRDIGNREPFFFAALHLVQQIDNENPHDGANSDLIKKAKEYFFEAYLHQYGSVHHAGIKLSPSSIGKFASAQSAEKISDKLQEILDEQEYLREQHAAIKNSEIKEYMESLWHFLKIEQMNTGSKDEIPIV